MSSPPFGLGFIIGPTLGGILPIFFGPRLPFLLAALAAALTVFITWWALDETVTPEQRARSRDKSQPRANLRDVLRSRALAMILVIGFVGQFGFGMLQSTFALYGESTIFPDAPDDRIMLYIGLLLAVVGLSQVITQTLLLRRLVVRLGEAWLVVLGNLARAAGMAIYAGIAMVWMAPIASLLFAFGMGTTMPALQSMATRTAPEDVRGGILGLYQSAMSLAIILSTAIAGSLLAIQPRLPYIIGTVLMLAVVPPAIYLARRFPRSPDAAPESESDIDVAPASADQAERGA